MAADSAIASKVRCHSDAASLQAGLGVLCPQQRAHRRDEFGGLDGLHQVAVGAALEALDLLLGGDNVAEVCRTGMDAVRGSAFRRRHTSSPSTSGSCMSSTIKRGNCRASRSASSPEVASQTS